MNERPESVHKCVDRATAHINQTSSSQCPVVRRDGSDEQSITVPIKAEGIAMERDRVIIGRIDLGVTVLHQRKCSCDFHYDSLSRHVLDAMLQVRHCLFEALA